ASLSLPHKARGFQSFLFVFIAGCRCSGSGQGCRMRLVRPVAVFCLLCASVCAQTAGTSSSSSSTGQSGQSGSSSSSQTTTDPNQQPTSPLQETPKEQLPQDTNKPKAASFDTTGGGSGQDQILGEVRLMTRYTELGGDTTRSFREQG